MVFRTIRRVGLVSGMLALVFGLIAIALAMGFVRIGENTAAADNRLLRENVYFELARMPGAVHRLPPRVQRDILQFVFGECGYPVCRVQNNGGGIADIFLLAGAIINADPAARLIIDGPCASACVMAADLARDKTCITPRATFLLHKARYQKDIELFGQRIKYFDGFKDPDQSYSIDTWDLPSGRR